MTRLYRNVILGSLSVALLAAACGGKAAIDGAPSTGSGVGGLGGSGGTTASDGTNSQMSAYIYAYSSGPPVSCEGLEASYQAVLDEARACSPEGENRCTLVVKDRLSDCCPEATLINKDAVFVYSAYEELRKEYVVGNCSGVCKDDCPALPAELPGLCDPATKRCVLAVE